MTTEITNADLDQTDFDEGEIESVVRELVAIRDEMIAEAIAARSTINAIHPSFKESAQNLLHYLVLRRRDVRPLQMRLASLGLSSIGRAESHVLATIESLLMVLRKLSHSQRVPLQKVATVDFAKGLQLLSEHTQGLLGAARPDRDVRIMVTMPREAASEYSLVHDLLEQGMDCMRINCAHDETTSWLRMIANLRRAEIAQGRSCRVVMDLAGPKLRTGPIEPGPKVVKVRPQRNVLGQIIAAARVWLTPQESPKLPPSPANASLPVPAWWLAGLGKGNRIHFKDARGANRYFDVVDVTENGCWAESSKTAYVVTGTRLRLELKGGTGLCNETEIPVGDLLPCEISIGLQNEDRLVLSRDCLPGRPATFDSDGKFLLPPTIGCTIPEVFDDVRPGDSIFFDDGKIGGLVEKVEAKQVLVRINQTRVRGEKLRADKGINLPDSNLGLAALTAKDLEDLVFVAEHADVVELSFANRPQDVEMLQQHLDRLGNKQLEIVLKIETRCGFENLPNMLLTAMRARYCGVMIARGDLAVECGFERLAEIQEEILWICEAAHVPVIWATQVLETLAKEGQPSRAEITDAAMGHRAECVMLNKGPHMVRAVGVLNDILRRMQSHQTKKRAMLRELRLAHRHDS